MALRVTHNSLFTTNLANLQHNLAAVQSTQQQLSSGKLLTKPSDDPGGAGAALRQRAEIDRNVQLERNASDGIGWLETADSALGSMSDVMGRVRELLVQANSTGTLNEVTAESIAVEIDALRDQMLSLANTSFLNRPIFGGTTQSLDAYDAAGNFQGNTQNIERSVRPGVSLQVNVNGPEVFGPAGADTFQFLADVSDHLRTDWSQLNQDLGDVDTHMKDVWRARSKVGARYAQLDAMRSRTQEDLLQLRHRLSEIEDIDLPAKVVELQLQETAYQAALSATARAVQPSLLDFLR